MRASNDQPISRSSSLPVAQRAIASPMSMYLLVCHMKFAASGRSMTCPAMAAPASNVRQRLVYVPKDHLQAIRGESAMAYAANGRFPTHQGANVR